MRRKFFFSTAIALVLLLNAVPAAGHDATFPTDLTVKRRPTGVVDAGTQVRILGKLKSDKAACFRRSEIRLIEVGAGLLDTDQTTRRGKYRFRVRIQETTVFRVRFAGKSLETVHPFVHLCDTSRARIRVRVA